MTMRTARAVPLVALACMTLALATARPALAADPAMSECLSANDNAIKLGRKHLDDVWLE